MTDVMNDLPQCAEMTWDAAALGGPLAEIRYMQGYYLGRMAMIGRSVRDEASIKALSQEAGAMLRVEPGLKSDVSRTLRILRDATENARQPFSTSRLAAWHRALLDRGVASAGVLRTTPIEGGVAPERLAQALDAYVQWADRKDGVDGLIRAALGYLWLMQIKPFAEGNAALAGAVSVMMLARSENDTHRFYSLLSVMIQDHATWADQLQRASAETADMTGWMAWVLLCMSCAIDQAQRAHEKDFKKARFWEDFATAPLNERQRAVMNMLLEGRDDMLTTSKWAKVMRCSQDTALRDIQGLMDLGLLSKDAAGGRSTRYFLAA